MFPKTVFSRLATAVSKKTKRMEPTKPPMMVKAGVDVSKALPICMPLNRRIDTMVDTKKDALSFRTGIVVVVVADKDASRVKL